LARVAGLAVTKSLFEEPRLRSWQAPADGRAWHHHGLFPVGANGGYAMVRAQTRVSLLQEAGSGRRRC